MMKKGHELHALAFFILYIYTVFAQIGYAYFPELSDSVGAYFGPMLFYKYWAFMFFSFVFTFLLYKKMNPIGDKKGIYIVKSTSSNYGEYFFFLIAILIYLALNLYFERHRELFGYGGGSPMGGPWFGVGFWIFTLCNFILYTLARDQSNKIKKRIFSSVLFFLYLVFFLQVTIAAGVRSPILYFFISIAFYELLPIIKTIKYQKRKIFILIVSIFLVISALTILRDIRLQDKNISFSSFSNYDISETKFLDKDWPTAILSQDYYLPSHTLFVSMQFDIVDPLEVVKSNLANSLVLLKYPFLTTTILERGLGIKNERGVGWSYHYFVEGYNALGPLGILYNALFWNLFMTLWSGLSRSNSRRHNKAMLSISVLVIALVMKTQNSAFIQFYWMILLPGLALLLLANNSTIAFFKKKAVARLKNE